MVIVVAVALIFFGDGGILGVDCWVYTNKCTGSPNPLLVLADNSIWYRRPGFKLHSTADLDEPVVERFLAGMVSVVS